MLIDWFTIGAQALNFLILVWLMKRFLYTPILNAIDAREKRIAAELADAAAKKAEAKKERDDFQHKNDQFDQQRASLLTKATDDANAQRERLLDDARKAVNALSAKRADALRNEAQHLSDEISRRTREEVFAIARKTLTDLASAGLEERAADVFIRRLRAMEPDTRVEFADALGKVAGPVLVRSAFDLPVAQQTAIQTALNETFSSEFNLRFETAPELVSGIDLTTNGHKLAWSIADYLAGMQADIDELLKVNEQPASSAQVEAAVAHGT
ncbi:MAG: F0F1 ATP synthase subunit B [Gemmatimonadaceae bacterium]